MMRRTLLIAALCVGTGATVAGCAGTQAGRATANALVPVADENKLGAQMEEQLAKELTFTSNQALQNYVSAMGQKIAGTAKRDTPNGISFTFTVVQDDNTVNAFAIPGGHIYIYTGLLKKADSEAEIAGVLGHEIAHVTRRHVAQQLAAQYGIEQLAAAALGKDPGLISTIVASVAANGYMLKNSRDAEKDADDYGLQYTIRAGYNPMGFVTFFKKLGEAQIPEFLSTHPDPAGRAATAKARIAKMSNPPSYLGATEWKAKKAEFGL